MLADRCSLRSQLIQYSEARKGSRSWMKLQSSNFVIKFRVLSIPGRWAWRTVWGERVEWDFELNLPASVPCCQVKWMHPFKESTSTSSDLNTLNVMRGLAAMYSQCYLWEILPFWPVNVYQDNLCHSKVHIMELGLFYHLFKFLVLF